MADRSVKVTVGANVSPLKAAMQDGSRSVDGLSGSITRTGAAGTSAFEKLGNGAKTLAKGIGAAEVVLGGLYASAMKTGIGFNSLQQTSRAALTAIMGSAEAANRQMDELFKFTQTSPLPKQVYIEAQQTLLGFGVEASKVIPILKAIDDTTIAIGGNAQTVSELTLILGQIQSQGKITGRELMRLGMHGVDAAQIIGDQMGVTAGVIRDQISKSAIDADTALSALASGLEKRFGGASEMVKKQFTGALDRMKAAWRDLGGELAKDLVDPVSGGKLVVWLNDVADLIRAMTPAVSTLHDAFTSAFTGPGIHSGLQSLVTWFKELDPAQVQAFASRLGELAPIISAVGAASLTMATSNLPVIGGLMKAVGPLPAALAAAAMASPELRRAIMDLLAAAGPLVAAVAQLGGALLEAGQSIIGAGSTLLTSLVPAVQALSAILTPIIQGITLLAQGFSLLPEPVRMFAAALVGLALAKHIGLLSSFSGGLAGVASAARGVGPALLGAFGGPVGIAIAGAASGLGLLVQRANEGRPKIRDFTDAISANTGALGENADASVRAAAAEDIANWVKLGGDADVYTNALLGNRDALLQMPEQIRRVSLMSLEMSAAWRNNAADFARAGITAQDVAQAFSESADGTSDAWARLTERAVTSGGLSAGAMTQLMVAMQEARDSYGQFALNVESVNRAQEEAAERSRITGTAVREGAKAQQEAYVAWLQSRAVITDTASAFDIAADSADGAEDRIKALTSALSEAAGRAPQYTSTVMDMQGRIDDLSKALHDAKTKTDDQGKATRDLDGKLAAFADQTYSTIAAVIEQSGSMDAGKAAADQLRNGFIDMAIAQGYTRGEAINLANQLGILQGIQIDGKTFTITAIDQASGVLSRIVQLASMLGINTKSAGLSAGAAMSDWLRKNPDQLGAAFQEAVKKSMNLDFTAYDTPGSSGGGGGGGGGGKSLSDEAKKAAKAAEDAKKAHKSLGDDIKAIQKASTGSVADMRKAMSQLREDMKVAGENKKAIAETKVLEQQLVKAMQMRERVTKQLEDAQKRLNDLTKAYADRVAAVQSSIVSKSADVVGTYDSLVKAAQDLADAQNKAAKEAGETTTEITAQAVSIGDLVSKMQEQLGALKDWAANIEALRGKGLNNTALQQLIDAGPQAAESAALLAGASQSQIAEINRITDETSAIGEKIGTLSAESMYGQGITAAEKLVEGLTDRQKLIKDTISDLAKGVKVLKKSDMKDQGVDAMTSLIKGLKSQDGPLTDAMRDLANSALAAFRASLEGDSSKSSPTSAKAKVAKGAKGGYATLSGFDIPGAADGEWITGGTKGKDSVLRWLMPGEAVIPTAHAQANKPVVDALITGRAVNTGTADLIVEIRALRAEVSRASASAASTAVSGMGQAVDSLGRGLVGAGRANLGRAGL